MSWRTSRCWKTASASRRGPASKMAFGQTDMMNRAIARQSAQATIPHECLPGHSAMRDGDRFADRLGGEETELAALQHETGHLAAEHRAGVDGDAVVANDRRLHR